MRKYNNSRQSIVYRIFKYCIFVFISFFLAFPLYWILASSFRPNSELLNDKLAIIPNSLTLTHYLDAFVKVNLVRSFINSISITLFTVIISIFLGILMAYALLRYKFAGVNLIKSFIVLTQFIPIVVFIIPLYVMMSRLHLINTYYSLVITYLSLALPVGTILLITYLKDVPVELEEAARIDGCSTGRLLLKIIFPLALPGIMSTAIFIFISIWQEFLVAVSFISKDEANTVSVSIQKFTGTYGTDWGGIMAGSMLISIPALVLFITTQKLFVNNIVGGVKG
jgi:ABC-type glycerol-3-phosphate transport system permease component